MNRLNLAIAVAAMTMSGAALAAASMPKPEVIEKDAKGRPTKVMIEGKAYVVCTADGQDGCINPREAGLRWGNTPLDHWPGKPASEM